MIMPRVGAVFDLEAYAVATKSGITCGHPVHPILYRFSLLSLVGASRLAKRLAIGFSILRLPALELAALIIVSNHVL